MTAAYGDRARIGVYGTVNALAASNMLHILVEKRGDGSIVRLSGTLGSEFVGEADRACAAADGRLVIDAGQLQSADAEGLAWLVAALDQEVQITGLSGYLELTDEQADALKPVMGTAMRGLVAVIVEYSDKRMSVRNKLGMANKLKKIQADMNAGMGGILTPEQIEKYNAMKEAQKSE